VAHSLQKGRHSETPSLQKWRGVTHSPQKWMGRNAGFSNRDTARRTLSKNGWGVTPQNSERQRARREKTLVGRAPEDECDRWQSMTWGH
jgi:hypothetical protein